MPSDRLAVLVRVGLAALIPEPAHYIGDRRRLSVEHAGGIGVPVDFLGELDEWRPGARRRAVQAEEREEARAAVTPLPRGRSTQGPATQGQVAPATVNFTLTTIPAR